MIEITFVQLFLFITILWVAVRSVITVRNRQFTIKRELQLMLVYICLVVIARFVYFALHRVDGKIVPLKLGLIDNPFDMISLSPFYFLIDRYDGWLTNIIGNIAMFIPVGIVWPVCFRELDSIKKTVLAGFGFTLFIELTQLFCPERHSDLDDLILNTTGVFIGACIVFAIRKSRSRHQSL